MRNTALEKLAEKGIVFIQKKGDYWNLEGIRKDEVGFLVDRPTECMSQKFPGVAAVMGDASDYAALAFLHGDATSALLFGKDHINARTVTPIGNYQFARTPTSVAPAIATVGDFMGKLVVNR